MLVVRTGQNRRPPVIAKIGVLIGCADEYALARLDHLKPTVARPVALGCARDEGFEQRSLSSAHCVQLGDLYQPFPT
jgi:hypothetical protein